MLDVSITTKMLDIFAPNQTMAQEWLPGQGISKTYADEILTGIVRNTYGQNLSMHTLGLLVSAIGSDSNLYSGRYICALWSHTCLRTYKAMCMVLCWAQHFGKERLPTHSVGLSSAAIEIE
ncbi:hypothetical protein SARC_06340 [Sphaeroforma arctica JP610]|uniref:Prenylcysteine lyase domain-containing protein n=1 Tax=Sphaeroforma arctica JP610 TaxID=667725 RepID=A0A0L0FXM6_9EUKA|nr:hypothetical protein SARC_06340 [Sphaeroforma arctica JP610]KNC81321.1 hypothetical protein SARC_06340 [Sphaeroforma arctica JP610]|eukprot:XP_014155223.1 hypothetical protein SARC_06340 [Sphaeroforma arctica JP610]